MFYTIGILGSAPSLKENSFVDKALISISKNHKLNDVNGIFIYSQGNTFKVMEGEKEKIVDILENDKKNTLYSNLIIVFAQPLSCVKIKKPEFYTIHHMSQPLNINHLTGNLNTSPSLIKVIKEILNAFNWRLKENKIQSFLIE